MNTNSGRAEKLRIEWGQAREEDVASLYGYGYTGTLCANSQALPAVDCLYGYHAVRAQVKIESNN